MQRSLAAPPILLLRPPESGAWFILPAVRTVVGLLTGMCGRTQGVSERQLARRAQMLNCDGQATALSGGSADLQLACMLDTRTFGCWAAACRCPSANGQALG